jgi:hypothetical protein
LRDEERCDDDVGSGGAERRADPDVRSLGPEPGPAFPGTFSVYLHITVFAYTAHGNPEIFAK